MGDISQLKAAIETLSPQEQAEFRDWFLERDAQLWDEQIADDLKAGRLDALIAEAKADRAAGRVRDL
jgi:hypothetical protein